MKNISIPKLTTEQRIFLLLDLIARITKIKKQGVFSFEKLGFV
jgi:hypothetical protein